MKYIASQKSKTLSSPGYNQGEFPLIILKNLMFTYALSRHDKITDFLQPCGYSAGKYAYRSPRKAPHEAFLRFK